MKTNALKTILAALAVIAGLASVLAAAPLHLVCAVPDSLDKDGGSKIAVTISTLVQQAPVGTTMTFVSGGDQPRTEFDFTKQTYPNRKVEGRALKKFNTKLNGLYLRAAQKGKEAGFVGTLNVPEIVRLLPAVMRSKESRVLFLGNTLFTHNSRDSFVDHTQAEVGIRFRRPSYAHLTQAKRFQSSFAMPEVRPDLGNIAIQWFNPYGEAQSGPRDFQREAEEFLAAYLNSFSARLAIVRSDSAVFAKEVYGQPDGFVSPMRNERETVVRMFTLADLQERLRQEEAEKARLRAELLAKREAEEQAKRDAEAHRLRMQELQRQQEVVDAQRKLVQLEKQAAYEAKMARPVALPNLSEIFIADCSGSMKSYLDRVGREMSMRKLAKSERIALILYSDHDRADQSKEIAYLFSESSKASDLASAFRGVDLLGGTTVPEALDRGLLVALETLRERPNSKGVKISIFTDAVPHQPGDISEYPSNQPSPQALIGQLLSAGHSVTLYRCGGVDTGWVPKGVVIKDL